MSKLTTKEQERRVIDLAGLVLSDPGTWPDSADRLLLAIEREATMSGLWSGDEILATLRQFIDARIERQRTEWHEGLTADDLNWLLGLSDKVKAGSGD